MSQSMSNTKIKVKEELLTLMRLDGGGLPVYNYRGKPFTGFIIEYFPNNMDVIESEIEYTNGYQEGVEREFYENGIKKYEFYTKNNMLDGVTKRWDEDGNLISEKVWAKGKLIEIVK
jgi:antitoxin component YwqK of YwqJK toxin-antitoxin module